MTDAREEILGRIRAGLADLPRHGSDDAPAWTYGRATPMEDVPSRFVTQCEDYHARVVRVPDAEVAGAVARLLTEAGVASVAWPSGLAATWRAAVEAAGVDVVGDEPPLSNAQLDAIGGVVTAARVAIAETGTIVLDHDADQGRRALTLLPDVHLCVVRADQIVSDVPEAVARLRASIDAGRPLTWISGGSATSDIELQRVDGVHGPRTLLVVLVG